jgi:hypothetical protein
MNVGSAISTEATETVTHHVSGAVSTQAFP